MLVRLYIVSDNRLQLEAKWEGALVKHVDTTLHKTRLEQTLEEYYMKRFQLTLTMNSYESPTFTRPFVR